MHDRRSIKNQKSKIKNPLDSRPRAGSVVNQKSKIKNQKSSKFPPSAGSGVNQKSKI